MILALKSGKKEMFILYISDKQIRLVFDDNLGIIFYSSLKKHMFWALIGIALQRWFLSTHSIFL